MPRGLVAKAGMWSGCCSGPSENRWADQEDTEIIFDRYQVQIVDGLTYNGATRLKKRSMLPNAAGIYIWTLQLGHHWTHTETSADSILEAISAPFKHIREQRFDSGKLGHYRRVQLYDEPAALSPSTMTRLTALVDGGSAELSWSLMCATLLQRPLYVGKALNFRDRLPSHFGYKSKFSRLLREHGMSVNDCAVVLCPVTIDGLAPDEGDDGDDLTGSAEDVPPLIEDDDDLDAEEYVPPGKVELNNVIQLAESLVIRTSHPLFNERMD